MKTNKHKSIRLLTALAAVLAAVSAFFAYAATVDDLTPITGTAELLFTEANLQYRSGSLNIDNQFLIGESNHVKGEKGPFTFGSDSYWGAPMNNRQVYFKIADDHTADVTIYVNIINTAKYIHLKDSAGNDVVKSTNATTGTEIITTTGLAAGTYYITGDNNDAMLCGIKVNAKAASTGSTFTTITRDYTWRVKEGETLNNGFNYETRLNYTGTDAVSATLPENNGPAVDDKRAWGFLLDNSAALGFKVGKGKGTIKFYVGAYGTLTLKKGESYEAGDPVTCTKPTDPSADNKDSNGNPLGAWCATDVYTCEFENSKDEVYWVNIDHGSGTAVVLAGIDVTFDGEVTPPTPAAPDFATINGDFSWICTSDVKVKPGNNTEVTVDGVKKYYTYYNSDAEAGVTAESDPKVLLHGGPSLAYNLNGKKLGFKVAPGKYVIDFYVSTGASVSLYTDDEAATGSDNTYKGTLTTTSVTVNGVSGDRVRTIVDKSSDTADQVYWVKVESGSLAGFDVMFDISSASDISSVTALSASDEWTPTSTELPYATGLGTLGTYISGAGTNFYHLGQTVSLQSQYNNCVPLGDNRAIGFKLAAGNQNTISIAVEGSGNFKVVSGADPFNGAVEVTSSTVAGTNPHSFALPSTEETTLWIIGDETVNVKNVTYTIEKAESGGPLVDIKNYYLWRAGDETVDANRYFAANYLRHNTDGSATALTPDANTKVRVLGVETPTVALDGTNEIALKLASGTKGEVKIYYTGSAPEVKTGGDETTLSGDAVTVESGEVDGAKVATYSFDLSADQLVHIQGNGTKIAAIEVVTDKGIPAVSDDGPKNIDWYVSGDVMMIAGSERYDESKQTEYAEFYVSKGRKPHVAFFMPSILKIIYKETADDHTPSDFSVEVNNGGSKDNYTFPKLYDSKGKFIDQKKNGNLWDWMTQDWTVNPKSDNTQTFKITATDLDKNNKARTWNVELKFHFIDCPSITVSDVSTTAKLTMKAAKGYESFPVFYTIDSTDPANLDDHKVTNTTEEYYSTKRYGSAVTVDVNCIALAGQYVTTDKPFYTAGPGSQTSNVFKLLSEQKYVMLNDREDIIYVTDPAKSEFKRNVGDIDKLYVDGKRVLSFMYGQGSGSYTDAVRFFRTIGNEDKFHLGAVDWGAASGDQDGGYSTYMDPYQWTMMGSDPATINKGTTVKDAAGKDIKLEADLKFNANPDTEMNGGIGGADTENGGMFLQPVAGDFFRLEPEYDGIATVWVRQKGMVDYGNMYNGEISRRPVYVVDEDGVVQRGSTIKPTALYHKAIDGVYAMASAQNELRSSFANTWKYATSYDEGWKKIHARTKRADAYFPFNYELMQIWFGDILKFTTSGTDSHVPGTSEENTNVTITIDRNNSVNIDRFSRIGNQLLYRDDWMSAREAALQSSKYPQALANPFARYGYEIPNFGYVRYRIPVKAGKTYYMGGRGTKNGFVAMQFEPMSPNYNNLDYKRNENPRIKDNGTERATLEWDIRTEDTEAGYDAAAAVAEYSEESKVTTYTIDENATNPTKWWESLPVIDRGNMLKGTTINVDLKRNFKAGQWYPIVLPFSVSETRLREMFGQGVKVLYLDPLENSYTGDTDRKFYSVYHPAIKDTELKFTYHHYQMLYANTPAFICPSEITTDSKLVTTDGSGNTTFHFRRVCFKGGDIKSYDIGGGYEVTGSYVPTTGSANGEMYYISNETGSDGKTKVVMYHSRHGIDMKGTRCWIRPKSKTNAPIMTMGFGSFSADGFDDDSGTTGITDVISDEAPATLYDNDNVYDIMGRVVATGSTAGLPSGIYIFKGKKVYVK